MDLHEYPELPARHPKRSCQRRNAKLQVNQLLNIATEYGWPNTWVTPLQHNDVPDLRNLSHGMKGLAVVTKLILMVEFQPK